MALGPAERAALQRWLVGGVGAPEGPLDWAAVAHFARSHGISGLVWNAAPTGPGEGAPGHDAWRSLRLAALKDTARFTLALHGFARVTRLLDAAGVACIGMKGVALGVTDPAYATRRHVSDLDLLVRVQDLAAADAALRSAGMTPVLDRPTLDGREGLVARASLESAVAVEVYLDPAGVPIDLHVRPPAATAAADLVGLWQRSQLVAVAGTKVRVPSVEDQLLILCEHVFDRHGAEPGMLARHMADLARLVALGAGETTRSVPAVAESLGMLEEARAASPVHRARFPSRLERSMSATLSREESSLRRLAKAVRVRAALVRETGWHAVFPARAYIAASYGVSPQAWWLPFLYVRRLMWDQPLRILGWRSKLPGQDRR